MAKTSRPADDHVCRSLIKTTTVVHRAGSLESQASIPFFGDSHHNSSRQSAALIPAKPCDLSLIPEPSIVYVVEEKATAEATRIFPEP